MENERKSKMFWKMITDWTQNIKFGVSLNTSNLNTSEDDRKYLVEYT